MAIHEKKKLKPSLASIESLSTPLIQEIVLWADISCSDCQTRVAHMMSRLKETDSILINVLEKEVTLTCRYPSGGVVEGSTYRNPITKIATFKRLFRFSSCT